ncbi:DUF6783 domain-containing protein [Blautia faecicola]|uniref:DUF6783 domain-containing protein n=1 Tax=Blautia faecicola TaxID=2509240 RepID=UPI002FE6C08C
MFYPYSVAVARYAALIRIKSPTNWDSQLTKSLFQTRSRKNMSVLPNWEDTDMFFIILSFCRLFFNRIHIPEHCY